MRPLLAIVLLAASGCAGYEPRPIDERAVLRELDEVRLEMLRPATVTATSRPAPPRAFDVSDGLSADEAVAAALVLNAELRSLRKERGVAEGEVIAAGLLPNPDLQVTWLFIEGFTKNIATSGLGVSLNWAPPRPGELAAKEARATARVDEVRWQIEAKERAVASETRKAYAAAFAAEARMRLAEASLRVAERVRSLTAEKQRIGVASRFDATLAEIEFAGRLRERELVLDERAAARLELNRLLGVPPGYEVPFQAGADPLAFRSFPIDGAALEARMIERRPDLRAAKAAYEQAEQSLRLAYLQRWPWFRFGPAYERGEGGVAKFGIGLGVDLPIANLNQGEIARLEAEREKLGEAFRAKVHAARAEVSDALRRLRSRERLIALYERSLRPAIEAADALIEAGIAAREVDLLQVVATQDRALSLRAEEVKTELGYWEAAYDLERAIGAPLVELNAGKD